ncbi:MAG: hypothetical protein RBR23_01840 [Arcobacteraceae bacterium]|jgi:hypothetical protein|nr:hypothetical protein [Arcobacteraceae bacterium]
MVRQIIKPTSEFYNIHIPKEYINQEVEILVLPFSYCQTKTTNNIQLHNTSLAGSLSKYANPTLIPNEKDIAWEQVSKDKDAIS